MFRDVCITDQFKRFLFHFSIICIILFKGLRNHFKYWILFYKSLNNLAVWLPIICTDNLFSKRTIIRRCLHNKVRIFILLNVQNEKIKGRERGYFLLLRTGITMIKSDVEARISHRLKVVIENSGMME